ncbi:MAG: pyruvate kinase [Gammaproteobacteria bacterium]|nr:pyruvate kinase [Gammaproteobacteria bacterium]
MRRHRKAKIVATLGPASSSEDVIRRLFDAGVDVFRLNFSHGTHDDHAERYRTIRRIEQETGRPIGILLDIQGPKLRLGSFSEGPVWLSKGQRFRLDLDPAEGGKDRVHLPHPEIFASLSPGRELLVNDGRVKLGVLECDGESALTEVLVRGEVSSHKGVNVPGVILPISVITEKDRADIEYGLSLGVDWVAQSFVQQPEDVRELRGLVGDQAAIMVKLEKPSALDNLDGILDLCDGAMVARGDLGVELPPQQVPVAQKEIVRRCRRDGKPVVIATHMLDSMVQAPVPTRAEASDVANSVYDGADAVMLSAESAAGEYPVESVAMMDSIIHSVEQDILYRNIIDAQRPEPDSTAADAICNALQTVTGILSSTVTVTYTTSGSTSIRAARERPDAPILGVTPELRTARFLSMVWGVHPVVTDVANTDANLLNVIDAAKEISVREGFAASGDNIIIAAGIPFGISGTTNSLHVATID